MIKYKFTHHARTRFKEHFPKLVQDGDVVRSLCVQMRQSKIDKSINNNTRFTSYLYEKYGYEKKFNFLVNDQIVFVCERDDLITVYPRRGSKFDGSASRFRR